MAGSTCSERTKCGATGMCGAATNIVAWSALSTYHSAKWSRTTSSSGRPAEITGDRRGAMPSESAMNELYEKLHRRFAGFARELTIEQRTDLDGILWALANELAAEPQKEKSDGV